jgi:hypothetical protein
MQRITVKYDFIRKISVRAWCLQVNKKMVWVPRSEGIIDLDNKLIDMPYWLAEKAGIEAYEDESP